jgi:hypothetical protein
MYHDYIMCPPHFVLRLNKPVERNRWGRAGIEMRDIKNAILRVGVGVGGIRVRSGTRLEEFGARKSCSAPAFVLELVLLHPTVRENFGECHETS